MKRDIKKVIIIVVLIFVIVILLNINNMLDKENNGSNESVIMEKSNAKLFNEELEKEISMIDNIEIDISKEALDNNDLEKIIDLAKEVQKTRNDKLTKDMLNSSNSKNIKEPCTQTCW